MARNISPLWGALLPDSGVLTADDLLRRTSDGHHYELVEGRLLQMASAGGEHGVIVAEINAALHTFVKVRRLGVVTVAETGFLLSPVGTLDTVLAPDVAFVQAGRTPKRGTPGYAGYWRLAPDLVVEVASPSQSRPELRAKAETWVTAGVRLCWLIWPADQQAEVWRVGGTNATMLTSADALDGEDVVPGFSYPLGDLFAS